MHGINLRRSPKTFNTLISIIIPHFNTPGLLNVCIERIQSAGAGTSGGLQHEIIVVDDCSVSTPPVPDGVRLEVHAKNRGFAASCNTGARSSRGDYLIFLNTDIEVGRDFFSGLKLSGVDIGGFRIEDCKGERQYSCRRFPGFMNFLFHRGSILTALFPGNRFSTRYLIEDGQCEEAEWVSGAAMAVSRDVYNVLHGFDEQFFLYFEDVDFCRRAHDMGFSITYMDHITVTHGCSGTTSRFVRKAVLARHVSMWRYYKKHMRRSRVTDIAVMPAIMIRGLFMWLAGVN